MAVLSRSTVEFARSARWCLGACVALYCLVAPVATQPPSPAAQILSAADVTAVLNAAMASLSDETMAVAVVDRAGSILGVLARSGASTAVHEEAVSLARTGAFFSNDQAPLSSRTVRFISGIHFPPGVPNTPPAALWH